MTAPRLPLDGLTVVEFSTSVAGPFAGQLLADLGATVFKVERPGQGDDARRWGPPFDENGMAPVFNALNRNKRSLTVDLKNEGEAARLRRFIVARADILLQNMRPGLLAGFGLDAGTLRAEAPDLIYCDLNAFGATGPKMMQPGYDPLMQACGGIMSVTGLEGQEPVRVGPSLIDQGAGMWAVIGILAALRGREQGEGGCDVGTSLYETAIGWLPAHFATYLRTGRAPRRIGSENAGIAPYKAFQASDGWLVVAAGNDNLFRRLAGVLGAEELTEDPRFATNPARVENREALNARVQERVAPHLRDALAAVLVEAGVPCAPVLGLDEVMEDPQFDAVGMLQSAPDTDMRLVGAPISFDGQRPPFRSPAPDLGEANSLLEEFDR